MPDLSSDDTAILVKLLRETIAADRFLLSPRVKALKAILDKLEHRRRRDCVEKVLRQPTRSIQRKLLVH